MTTIKVSLYVSDFCGMVNYLSAIESIRWRPLARHSVTSLILVDYMDSWSEARINAWLSRSTKKEYILSLPAPVAVALHQVMSKSRELATDQQLFLDKLRLALINYQPPTNRFSNRIHL